MAEEKGTPEGQESGFQKFARPRKTVVYNWFKKRLQGAAYNLNIPVGNLKLYTPQKREHPLTVDFREKLFTENRIRFGHILKIEKHYRAADDFNEQLEKIPDRAQDHPERIPCHHNLGIYYDWEEAVIEEEISKEGVVISPIPDDVIGKTEMESKIRKFIPLCKKFDYDGNILNKKFDEILQTTPANELPGLLDIYNTSSDWFYDSNVYLVKWPIGYIYRKDREYVVKQHRQGDESNLVMVLEFGIPQPHVSAIKHKDGRTECFTYFGKDNTSNVLAIFEKELKRIEMILNHYKPKGGETLKANLRNIITNAVDPALQGIQKFEDDFLRSTARDAHEAHKKMLDTIKGFKEKWQFGSPEYYFYHRYIFTIPKRYLYVGIHKDTGHPQFVLVTPKIPCKLDRGEVPISEDDPNVLNKDEFPANDPNKNVGVRGGLDENGMPLELSRSSDFGWRRDGDGKMAKNDLGHGYHVLKDIEPWKSEFYPGDTSPTRKVTGGYENVTVEGLQENWVNEGLHGFPTILEVANWLDFEMDNHRDDYRDGRWHNKPVTAYEYSRLMNGINIGLKSENGRIMNPAWVDEEGQLVREKNHDYRILDKNSPATSSHLNPSFDWRVINKKMPFMYVGRPNYYDTCTFIAKDRADKETISTRGIAKYIIERVIQSTSNYYKDARNILKENAALGEYLDYGPGMFCHTHSKDPLGAVTTDEKESYPWPDKTEEKGV
ncbi:MAG: hypothetical protein KJ709_09080 [Nanoarchaeota archaeon]|nr:hypothetical protein [Nanoarchaeota archaeon]